MRLLDWRRWPLGLKLALAMTALVMITGVGLALLSAEQDRQFLRAEWEEQARLILDTLTAAADDAFYRQDAAAITDIMEGLSAADAGLFIGGRAYDPAGRIIADAPAPPTLTFGQEADPFEQQLLQSETPVYVWEADALLAGRAVTSGQQRLGALSIRLSTAPLQAKIAAARDQVVSVAGAAIVTGALLAWVISRSITGPLRRLTEASRRLTEGDLTPTVTVRSGDETRLLADAFNAMTARLRATIESLAEARDEALAASRLKSHILATVSHDLRTPLSSILGYAEIMREGLYGPITDQQQETLDRLTSNAEQLLAFVNNLLDSAQLDAGKMDLEIGPFPPQELIESVESMVNGQAHRKGLDVITLVADDVPDPLVGDLARLEQIANNLVGNAVKFTEKGWVKMRLFRPDDEHWAIEVSDSGPGIPPEAQAHIFDAFWQVNGLEGRPRHKGSGLGLYIVRQLAGLMDGEITLSSQVGQGSTFTVRLPLLKSTPTTG